MVENFHEWDYECSRREGWVGRVTTRCQAEPTIELLKSKLSKRQLRKFRKSIFGKFLDMDCTFSPLLMHNVLVRRVRQSDAEAEKQLWFRIGDQLIRFSIHEWALITGLDCSNAGMPVATTYNIRDTWFNLPQGATITDVDNMIANLNFRSMPNKHAVRIAMYYFALKVFLTKPNNKAPDENLMGLMDDKEAFQSIPWGRLTWDTIFQYSLKSMEERTDQFYERKAARPELKSIGYNFPGFVYGFQAWIFETIPGLADAFATKLDSAPPRPRILKWKLNGSPSDVAIKNMLNQPQNILQPIRVLIPTDDEQREFYWNSAQYFDSTFPFWVTEYDCRPQIQYVEDGSSGGDRLPFHHSEEETDDNDILHERRERRKKHGNDSIVCRLDSLFRQLQEDRVANNQFKQEVYDKLDAFERNQTSFQEAVLQQLSSIVVNTDDSSAGPSGSSNPPQTWNQHYDWCLERPSVQHPHEQSSGVKKMISQPSHPASCLGKTEWYTRFRAWYTDHSPQLHMLTDKLFYTPVMDPNGCLTSWMVQQTVDSKFNEYGVGSPETNSLTHDKQHPVTMKKAVLRELQNENRTVVPKPNGNSPCSKDRGPSIDAIKVSGSKRPLLECPVSPRDSNAADEHLVYVRRKFESDIGKVSTSDSTTIGAADSMHSRSVGHQESTHQKPPDEVAKGF